MRRAPVRARAVYEDPATSVTLRPQEKLRQEGRGARSSHPATVVGAPRRARARAVDVRVGWRRAASAPAFETAALYKVGEEVARALAKATPDQEVVVKSIHEEKRFAIFHARYLTSFVAWMRGGDLVLHFSRVQWQIPKEDEGAPGGARRPRPQAFKVLAAEGIVPTGDQELAADWRNTVFREATNVKVGPGGKLLRRQVLMEGEAPAEARRTRSRAAPADSPPDAARRSPSSRTGARAARSARRRTTASGATCCARPRTRRGRAKTNPAPAAEPEEVEDRG